MSTDPGANAAAGRVMSGDALGPTGAGPIELPDLSIEEILALDSPGRKAALLGGMAPGDIAERDPRVQRFAHEYGLTDDLRDAFFLRIASRRQLRFLYAHAAGWLDRTRRREAAQKLSPGMERALEQIIPEWRTVSPKTLDGADPWPYSTGGPRTKEILDSFRGGPAEITRSSLRKWAKRQRKLADQETLAPELIALYDEHLPSWRDGGVRGMLPLMSLADQRRQELDTPNWARFSRRLPAWREEATRLEDIAPYGERARLLEAIFPKAWRHLSMTAVHEAWCLRSNQPMPTWPLGFDATLRCLPTTTPPSTAAWVKVMWSRIEAGDITSEVAEAFELLVSDGIPPTAAQRVVWQHAANTPFSDTVQAFLDNPLKDRHDKQAIVNRMTSIRRRARVGSLSPEQLMLLDGNLPGWRSLATQPRMLILRVAAASERTPGDESSSPSVVLESATRTDIRNIVMAEEQGLLARTWTDLLDDANPSWRNCATAKRLRGALRPQHLKMVEEMAGGPGFPASRHAQNWLYDQRAKLRRGTISPERASLLDELLPGWREKSYRVLRNGRPSGTEHRIALAREGLLSSEYAASSQWLHGARKRDSGPTREALDEYMPTWRTDSVRVLDHKRRLALGSHDTQEQRHEAQEEL